MQTFLQKLNKTVDEFVQVIQDKDLQLQIQLGHKNREPNVYATALMSGRFSLDKLVFNEQNIYFDISQFDDIDMNQFVYYAQTILYKTARFYLPYAQEMADKHKIEYSMHVWFPQMFSVSEQFPKYTHLLNASQALTDVVVDDQSIDTYNGLIVVNRGMHKISLPSNTAVLDIFSNCMINNQFDNLFINNDADNVDVFIYALKDTALYLYESMDEELTITLDDKYYVMNYKYDFLNGATNIYQKHFTYPIVAIKLGG